MVMIRYADEKLADESKDSWTVEALKKEKNKHPPYDAYKGQDPVKDQAELDAIYAAANTKRLQPTVEENNLVEVEKSESIERLIDEELIEELSGVLNISNKFNKLPQSLQKVIEEVVELFTNKNEQYKDASYWGSALHNNLLVQNNKQSALIYALTLVSKQDQAAMNLIFDKFEHEDKFNLRGGDDMLKERIMDGVVYRIMMLGLLLDKKG